MRKHHNLGLIGYWLLIWFINSINFEFPASEVPDFPTPGPPSFLVRSGQSLVYKYIYSSCLPQLQTNDAAAASLRRRGADLLGQSEPNFGRREYCENYESLRSRVTAASPRAAAVWAKRRKESGVTCRTNCGFQFNLGLLCCAVLDLSIKCHSEP